MRSSRPRPPLPPRLPPMSPCRRRRQNLPAGPDVQLQWSKAPVPLLRHRLRRHGRRQRRTGRRHPRRHAGRGQPRPQLRQGLLPVEDHVRRRPADPAAAAHEERAVRQGRRVPARLLGPRLRRDGAAVEARAEGEGPGRGRHVRLGPMDDFRGLRRLEADAGGLPHQQPRSERPPLHGLGGRHLHPNLRHGRADGVLRRLRARRRLRALGLEHGGDAPDPMDPGDRPPAVRPARADRDVVDLRAPHDRPVRRADHLQARHRPRDPELHRELHHPDRRGEPRIRRQARATSGWPTPTSATACGRSTCSSSGPSTPTTRRCRSPSDFDAYAKLMAEYTLDKVSELAGVPKTTAGSARQALRRPEDQGDVALDYGVQPARPRRLGEPPGLQPPSADRENLGARQQPVLAHRAAVRLRHGARGRHLLPSPSRPTCWSPTPSTASTPSTSGSSRRACCLARSATTPCSRTACSRTASSTPTGSCATTTSRRRRTPTTRPIRATATPRTSSWSPTPILPSRRWRPTSSSRPRCGSRRRAPTATPSGGPTSGTSSSTRRARRAPTCGS